MASFRILNQAPQYLLPDGSVNAGGSLTFYETNLTDLKDTWSNQAMGVPNSNPVLMDAAGRTVTDVWGLGEYGVVMKDAAGATIWTRNNVEAGGDAGLTLPTLTAGQFWSSDGSNIIAVDIIQVPDPTGQSGDILYSDGTLAYWGPAPEIPEIPDPEIVVGTGSLRAGVSDDNTKGLFQCGSGSASASGTKQTSAAIVYATPYATTPKVVVSPTGGPFATGNGAGGYYVDHSITSESNSGFTVTFNSNHGEENSDGNITSAVTFNYLVYGTVEVAP